MPIQKATIVVANMRTTEPFFSAFIVEVWNSTRTTKITGPIRVSGVWDAALGAYKQKEVLFFKGLTRGVVYSLRAAVATSHGGPVSAWTAWVDETAGDTTAPSSTYTPTWSAIANGAICSVAVSGAASDLDRYEWYGNTTGIAPSASTPSNWPNTPKSADVRQTFAGTAGQTIYAWIRGVDTSGNRQAWQTLNTKSVGTIDDVADGPTYARVLGTRVTLGVPYVYRGEWVGSTSYLRGDEVAYPSAAAGNIYACMTANSDATWTVAHWLLIGPASVDQVVDGTSYARTTPNQRDGGGYAHDGLLSGGCVKPSKFADSNPGKITGAVQIATGSTADESETWINVGTVDLQVPAGAASIDFQVTLTILDPNTATCAMALTNNIGLAIYTGSAPSTPSFYRAGTGTITYTTPSGTKLSLYVKGRHVTYPLGGSGIEGICSQDLVTPLRSGMVA